MRLLLATFKHETNTFSPVETRFERFFKGSNGVLSGAQAIAARTGTGTGIGGFIDVASRYGAEIVVPIVADAWPSGPVDRDAYERIVAAILSAAEGAYDGILLDLHGAMVVEGFDDGEGELLRRLRRIQPSVPIGVTLDMHANLYPDMVSNSTVITGYHTYPHVDIYEAGVRAAEIICKTIQGELRPVMTWGNRPMLPHVMRQGTHSGPNRDLQERCKSLEQAGTLAASLFVGFPHADIANAGLSVVVCTDANPDAATAVRDSLLDEAWDRRAEFLFESVPLTEAVGSATRQTEYPVILLDHCDNVASGGTMDTTVVLKEALAQGLSNAVFYAIYDPAAVAQAIQAGVGNKVTLSLGGKARLLATNEENPSLELTVTVRTISDGRFKLWGPMSAGVEISTGPTVVLDTGNILIVVASGHMEPFDLNCFYSLGIDVRNMHYVIMKSRVHWRAGFTGVARHVIECNGIGVTTSDYSKLKFEHVRRPIYPLDPF
ncbi:M81 family metallopeptidase [Paralcaligenes sp. KSB-10]|uniref:M81 family metallopeptidase n=1 Tax=Paralcaligenes sp. KSB-10 TaxID=2901142 RepID=UPI001E4B89D1|nr:M81 family metallopeptidase [Paralcaligenes sp. KSB-10]UHL63620.1 M81 family metallopeptidase [Paralcaligenes sp. KSB-10]